MSLSTISKVRLPFHAILLINREIFKMKLNILQSVVLIKLVDMMVQFVQNTCNALTTSSAYESLRAVIERYTWSNASVIQFNVLSKRPNHSVS